MTEHRQQSKAHQLLLEYRHTVWCKTALEAVPGAAHSDLHSCIRQLRRTKELVESLRNHQFIGEKLYWIIYATYMTERQPVDINEILSFIAKKYGTIPRRSYFRLRERAIDLLDSRLELAEMAEYSGAIS